MFLLRGAFYRPTNCIRKRFQWRVSPGIVMACLFTILWFWELRVPSQKQTSMTYWRYKQNAAWRDMTSCFILLQKDKVPPPSPAKNIEAYKHWLTTQFPFFGTFCKPSEGELPGRGCPGYSSRWLGRKLGVVSFRGEHLSVSHSAKVFLTKSPKFKKLFRLAKWA